MGSPTDVTTSHDTTDNETTLRHQIFDYAVSVAEGPYKAFLPRLNTAWKEYNDRFFNGELTPAFILISPPSSSKAEGDCSPWSGYGGKLQIRLRPSIIDGSYRAFNPIHDLENRWLYILDVLLHEMIHTWQFTKELFENSYGGHGKFFTAKANEIGAALGLPEVAMRHRRDKSIPIAPHWPTNVRPEGYYGNLIAEKKVKEPKEESPEEPTAADDDPDVMLLATIAGYQLLTPEQKEVFQKATDLTPVTTSHDNEIEDLRGKLRDAVEEANDLFESLLGLEENVRLVINGEATAAIDDDDDLVFTEITA